MATNFKPQASGNLSAYPEVRYFTVEPGSTFKVGELVYYDTSSDTIKQCGADPALIAGIALASAAFGLGTEWPGNIYPSTQIPVLLLKSNTEVFMASATTPTTAMIGDSYGIANNSGVWRVDTTDTSNTRVRVFDVFTSPQQEGFFVTFLAANLQFGT